MAKKGETILQLQVEASGAEAAILRHINRVRSLLAVQDELRESLINGTLTQAEYNTQLEYTEDCILENNRSIASLNATNTERLHCIEVLEGAMSTYKKEIESLTEEYENLTETERNSAAGKELRDRMSDLTVNIEKAQTAFVKYEDELKRYEGVLASALGINGEFASSIINMGKQPSAFFENLGTSMRAFGASISALATNPAFWVVMGVKAFEFWYDYNKGLIKASKLTTQFTGLTGEKMQSLRTQIQATADTFSVNFDDTLEATTTLARQFGISYGDALEIVQKGFVGGANESEKFLENIKESASSFEQAGYSAEEFISIATQTAKDGLLSEKGLKSIKNAGEGIEKMSQQTRQAIDGIGLDSAQIQSQLEAGSLRTIDVVKQVSLQLSTLPEDSEEAQLAVKEIFGEAGQEAGLTYLSTLKDIELDLDITKSKTGDLGTIQEQQMKTNIELQETVAALFDQTGGTFETMIGNAKLFATKSLTSIVKGLVDVINWVIDLYNKSLLVRAWVHGFVGYLKIVFNFVLTNLKLTFNALKLSFEMLKAMLTFRFDKMGDILKDWATNVKNIVTDLGNDVKDIVTESIDSATKGKIEPIKIPITTVNDTPDKLNNYATSKGKGENSNGGSSTHTNNTSVYSSNTSHYEKMTKERYEYERSIIILMEDGLAKQRSIIELDFKEKREGLELQLNNESDQQSTAAKILRNKLELLKKEEQDALSKLTEENWQREADKHLQRLNKELSVIQANSKRAFDIKKDQLEKEREIALKYANENKISIAEVNAKFDAEASKLEEERKKSHVEELLKIEKEGFDKRLKSIVGDGIAEKQAKLAIKQSELDAMARLQDESDEAYKARRKALADEIRADEEALSTARIEDLKNKGLTENEAKLQIKQQELDGLSQKEGESNEEYMARRLEMEESIRALRQQVVEEEFDTASAKVQAYQQMFDDMGSILEQFGANSAALGVFSKAMALAEIGINTAKAISAGIASAQTIPFPGNIAAVVTTIGTIMANVATAKKLLSKEKTPEAPKFATGGLVMGEGSGTSDSITARLSSGESVITAMGTQMFGPMLSAFNQIGGGVPIATANSGQQAIGQEMLTEAFRKALDSMPTPVVSVSEINDVNKRVDVLESYGSL